MGKTEDIEKIIECNKGNIAFMIGNGIHYQYEDCKKSWKDLLKDLWQKFSGTNIDIPDGISFTEFYDIIEMNVYKHDTKQIDIDNLIKYAEKFKNISHNKLDELVNINHDNIDRTNCFASDVVLKFKAQESKLKETFVKHIGETDNLSCEDFYRYLLSVYSNDTIFKHLRGSVKQSVVEAFPHLDNYKLKSLIEKLENLQAPILTTNFDTYMSDSIEAKLFKLEDSKLYKFSDFYPWNVYFSNKKLDNPLNGFGIWHINGMTRYKRSIRLGLCDYMGCVERARRILQGKNMNDFFLNKDGSIWEGANTWLNILFDKNLFIFGLTLDENEVFLRWLLIQRTKYSRMYNKNLKSWFVCKNITLGKEFFLKNLGFDIIKLSEFDELYDAFNRFDRLNGDK